MKSTLVLTFAGADRPGLVDLLSRTVLSHRGNWQESRMACLAGRFVGILELTVDPQNEAGLTEALLGLKDQGLEVHLHAAASGPPTAGFRDLRLQLTGTDREGIVQDIARALAARGVNVDEMITDCVEAPMAGGLLFKVEARLQCPPSLTLEDLRAELEALATEMMVDIQIGQSED